MMRKLQLCVMALVVAAAIAQPGGEDEDEKKVECRDKDVCKKTENGAFDCTKLHVPPHELGCTELTLANHVVGDDGAAGIAEVIKTSDQIKKIYLLYAKIGSKGAVALGEALKGNKMLKSLWIDGNDIGDIGAKAIAEGLAENDHLEVLGMSTCGVGPAGGRAIGKTLQKNHHLIQLAIGGNKIRAKAEEAVMEAVKANKDAHQRREYEAWVKEQQAKEAKEAKDEL